MNAPLHGLWLTYTSCHDCAQQVACSERALLRSAAAGPQPHPTPLPLVRSLSVHCCVLHSHTPRATTGCRPKPVFLAHARRRNFSASILHRPLVHRAPAGRPPPRPLQRASRRTAQTPDPPAHPRRTWRQQAAARAPGLAPRQQLRQRAARQAAVPLAQRLIPQRMLLPCSMHRAAAVIRHMAYTARTRGVDARNIHLDVTYPQQAPWGFAPGRKEATLFH